MVNVHLCLLVQGIYTIIELMVNVHSCLLVQGIYTSIVYLVILT